MLCFPFDYILWCKAHFELLVSRFFYRVSSWNVVIRVIWDCSLWKVQIIGFGIWIIKSGVFSRNFDIFYMESQVTRQTTLEKISKNVCYQRNQTTFIDGTLILIFSFRTVLKVRRNLSLEIFYEQKCVQVTRHSLYIYLA